MNNKFDEEFSPEETRRRLEAALRGARMAGAKHKVATKKAKKRKKR